MESKISKFWHQPWIQVILLIGFCFIFYFFNLGCWDLWNPDEPRYAQVAKEIVTGGDWVLMHYNGRVYSDKPPLFFWLIGLSTFLWGGFNSFSVRFVPALFGTLTVLLTFLLGRKIFNPRIGFFSGLILATSIHFAYLSTRANIDTTLTFFTTSSLFCFFIWYQQYREEKDQKEKDLRQIILYGFYVGMAFATLTKGPVGFLLPLLVSLFYLILQRDWRGIREMRLLTGMLLFLGIVLCWYFPAVWKGGRDYLSQTLFLHSVARYSQGWAKSQPIYFYLYDFPASFFPWILFLPSTFVYAYYRKNDGKRREFLFLTVWFAAIFIFFSLSKGKRALYLLPLFPAASLLVGKLLQDFISSQMNHFRREWVFFPIYLLLGVMFIVGAVIPWLISIRFPLYFSYSLPFALLIVGSCPIMFILSRFRHYSIIFFLIIGIIGGGLFYVQRVVFPLINPLKSARLMSYEIKSRISPKEMLCVFGGISTSPYNFYTDIVPILEIWQEEGLVDFLASTDRVFCLLDYKDFSKLQALKEKPLAQVMARHKIGRNEVLLISNQ